MEKLLILDSNSLMNRAFYALPPLTNSEGLHTNGILGFTTMLFKMREEIKPDYIVATFDRKAPTFRHKEYADYKAGRKKMPDELAEQFPVLKELLALFAINIFEIDGFEADDLIGTLACYAEKQGMEVYIVTGDRDALQLASKNIKVVITKKGITEKEIYDENRMIEDLGVTPKQFIDVKGLMGDTSDNIPGVPGIGEKTAFKLIQTYGSVENVLMNIEDISGKKIKENLMQYSEQAIFSKKLATIITDVPVEISLDEIKSKKSYDPKAIRKIFFKLQFKSLLDKIEDDDEENSELISENTNSKYYIIDSEELLDEFASKLDSFDNTDICVSFDLKNKEIFSKLHIERIIITDATESYVIEMAKLQENKIFTVLKLIFENDKIGKIGFDLKNTYTALNKLGIKMNNVKFDILIAEYLLDSSKGQYELINIIQEYLTIDIKAEGMEFIIKQNEAMMKLYDIMKEKIKEAHMEELMYNIELPLCEILASMEALGFKVNKTQLQELGDKFSFEIEKLQNEIFEMADENFNINSPKQLGKILFEKLDLPVIKKTKTGYSTNAEVLEELSDKHPIIDKITYFRQLSKLFSTYVEGLKSVIDEDSKIHSSFNQTVTATGRLSSTEPNLQNIPIKYEMGREIRKVFVPDNDNCVILSADYSQIELRVLAHIAKDENLSSAFLHNIDIHTKTASEVFKVNIDEVTSLMRSRAKAVNFGIVYGISDFSLSKDIKVSRAEAKSYMDAYFDRYPMVKKYMEDIVLEARNKSYITTICNRRRYIPEINASNKIIKGFGERIAMNAPIQGSAADIIKLAMINVFNKLNTSKLKSTLILQVHDELILNVYKDELDIVTAIVKSEMEKVLQLTVPLEVGINVGKTWYDAK